MSVIITGSGRGIGRATALELASPEHGVGKKLVLVDLDEAGLAETRGMLVGLDVEVITVVVDMAKPEAADGIVAQAIDAFGRIDAVVSNIGIGGAMRPLAEAELSEFEALMAVNTRATWLLGRAAQPHLAASRGALVATASLAAKYPSPPLAFYSVTKAALVMLVRQMALEWGPLGIRCNLVSPGLIETPAHGDYFTNPAYAELVKRNINATPVRRIGQPGDIASVIAFLISPEASFITGQEIAVDGGVAATLITASNLNKEPAGQA